MTNGKILITGGAGYIGSHVVKLLGEVGSDLVIYDNLSTGRKESILSGKLIEADLNDHEKLDEVFQNNRFDAVIHFAGSIVVPESVENPVKYYKNNTENSLNLISMCLKYKVNNFIFSSTAAVYGYGTGKSVTEEDSTNPINPYGRSKLMTEWMLEDAANSSEDFNYIALRYFNVAGADPEGKIGQCTPNATHLIKVALQAALGKRNKLEIFGTDYETSDGTCIRDYIHVTDLAQAHMDALKYLKKNSKSHVLNCGYGKGFSVSEVIEMVKTVTKNNFEVENCSRRKGDPDILISNADKIKSYLAWKPKYNDLKLIIETAYSWEKLFQKMK